VLLGAIVLAIASPPPAHAGDRYVYWSCGYLSNNVHASLSECIAAARDYWSGSPACQLLSPFLDEIHHLSPPEPGAPANGSETRTFYRQPTNGISCGPTNHTKLDYRCDDGFRVRLDDRYKTFRSCVEGPAPPACPEGMQRDPHTQRCEAPVKAPPRCPAAGNPCNYATGNKSLIETDYREAAVRGLEFQRFYSSQASYDTPPAVTGRLALGPRWRHTYERAVRMFGTQPQVVRANGQVFEFEWDAAHQEWDADPDVTVVLTGSETTGWQLLNNRGEHEHYDSEGKLIKVVTRDGIETSLEYTLSAANGGDGRDETLDRVTGHFGHSLAFVYEDGFLHQLIGPGGYTVTYGYSAVVPYIRLETVTYPHTPNPREYKYDKPDLPYALTRVLDENGDTYATYDYDAEGRVTLSKHGTSDGETLIAYPSDLTAEVQGPLDALGVRAVTTFTFSGQQGVRKIDAATQSACPTCNDETLQDVDYDQATGFRTKEVDLNGNITYLGHNSAGLETCRLEGIPPAGIPPAEADSKKAYRLIKTQWNTTLRVRTVREIYAPDDPLMNAPTSCSDVGFSLVQSTTDTYETDPQDIDYGRLEVRTIRDHTPGAPPARITAYAYYDGIEAGGPKGFLKRVTGPESAVTNFTYDPATGYLLTSTNAEGIVTEVTSHDAHGRPLAIEGPKHDFPTPPPFPTTTLTYHPRGWLRTWEVDGKLWDFQYDAVGQIDMVTTPEGDALDYDYDSAHRLISVTDGSGDYMAFTPDNFGNAVKTEYFQQGAGQPSRTTDAIYNTLNRLKQINGGMPGQVIDYQYDLNGNITDVMGTGVDDHTQHYDALNRLIKFNDALNNATTYTYDVLEQVTSVDPPVVAPTTYSYNGFGERLTETSPDRGTTIYAQHDGLGNPGSVTDARGVTVTHGYDALGRLTSIDYPNDPDTSYQYDAGCLNGNANGAGRLCKITDESGSTTYGYDARGNVVSKRSIVTGHATNPFDTGYEYDGAERLTKLAYPSGTIVDYIRNSATGRIVGVTVRIGGVGPALNVIDGGGVNGIGYAPFGPVTSIVFGNGVTSTYALDGDYRIVEIKHSGLDWYDIEYDGRDNLVAQIPRDAITGQVLGDFSFGYDALSRLDFVDEERYRPSPEYTSYEYDHNGNRVERLRFDADEDEDDDLITDYFYEANTNRITSEANDWQWPPEHRAYIMDPAGNITGIDYASTWRTDLIVHYGDHGRPKRVLNDQEDTTQVELITDITHNGLGQRVRLGNGGERAGDFPDRALFYDEGSHIIAVHGDEGPQAEYIYVDDRPVAMIDYSNELGGGTATLYYIHTDHRQAPWMVSDATGHVRWGKSSSLDPYPWTAPSNWADSIEMNLRLPGQIYLAELGLNYNYFRDYDPDIGRLPGWSPTPRATCVGENPLRRTHTPGLHRLIGPIPLR